MKYKNGVNFGRPCVFVYRDEDENDESHPLARFNEEYFSICDGQGMHVKEVEEAVAKMHGLRFEKAVKQLPNCIGGYDPLTHKKVEDLVWLCIFELDLYAEGEDSDIGNEVEKKQAQKFVNQWNKVDKD